MKPNYSILNSGHKDSFEVGNEFQDFVCLQLAQQGIILQNINSKKYQYEVGENIQGFEIKYDGRCTGCNGTLSTYRLSIEIAEKSSVDNLFFIPSGIYRNDNSWLYIQGNYDMFWIFSKNILQMLHKSIDANGNKRYEEHELATVKKYYLPLSDADRYCAKKIIINNSLQ